MRRLPPPPDHGSTYLHPAVFESWPQAMSFVREMDRPMMVDVVEDERHDGLAIGKLFPSGRFEEAL